MKKIFGLMLVMCSLVLLAGCAKDDSNKTEEGRRIYSEVYMEEFEGQEVEITNVIILNEDGTGLMAIQDTIPVTYDDSKITYVDGDVSYDYTIDGDVLKVNFGDFEREFSLSDESVLEKIPE